MAAAVRSYYSFSCWFIFIIFSFCFCAFVFFFRALPVVQVRMQLHDVGAIRFRVLDGYRIGQSA